MYIYIYFYLFIYSYIHFRIVGSRRLEYSHSRERGPSTLSQIDFRFLSKSQIFFLSCTITNIIVMTKFVSKQTEIILALKQKINLLTMSNCVWFERKQKSVSRNVCPLIINPPGHRECMLVGIYIIYI